jgi:hypothetical protein
LLITPYIKTGILKNLKKRKYQLNINDFVTAAELFDFVKNIQKSGDEAVII